MDWILIAENTWLTWWLDPLHWLAILKAGCALGFVVFVHELGHFAVAKMCGVKCEKFYIGFDFFQLKIGKYVILPRALFKFKYGETEYGIGSFPLGGYVKMLGQDDNPGNMEKENERSRAGAGGSAPVGKVQHDPRSYLAKSVPQRMAIISAGVIMNLIFAVIFATIAHKMGVPYRPCVVGDTTPGGAAWRANLKPGDKVMQINDGRVSEHLRWDWDMMNATIMAGVGGDMKLLVKPAAGKEETVLLHPRENKVPGDVRPVLGIIPERTTELFKQRPTAKYTPANAAKEPFQGGDIVVAIRPKSQASVTPVTSYDQIAAIFAQNLEEPVYVTVQRTNAKSASESSTTIEIEVAANSRRTLGLVMRRGAISGVRPGSPAENAGLREGDEIHQFAGQQFGDPMTFHFRLAPYYGKPIKLQVDRPDGKGAMQSLTLEIVPEAPRRLFDAYGDGDDFSIESLGIVYPVYQIVQSVLPGGPAAAAGLEAGDVITQLQLVPKADQRTEQKESYYGLMKKTPYELGAELTSWPYVESVVQDILPETEVKLFYRRPPKHADFAEVQRVVAEKDKPQEALLQPSVSPYFQDERGLLFGLRENEGHPADSWGEAFSLGLKQTYEDATKIVQILRKLVTGKMSPTNLGGIGTISLAATSEASQGTPRLLLFLTFLSANLAVVNFLPIPVLDGGHMMFLAWEGLFRRPVPEKWQFNLTLGGLAFVLCLFLFTNGLDFYRYIVVPITRWLG